MLVRAPTDGSIVHTIVGCVSEAEGVPVADLPPLYEAVDPEALVALVTSSVGRRKDALHSFSFEYSDSAVAIDASGDSPRELSVTPLDD